MKPYPILTMKLHPTIIDNIMDEIQNLSELGGVESHAEYIYNLKYLLFKIHRKIQEAERNMEENT